MWQERKPAIVSQRIPRTRLRTAASVEPTPTPRRVRSPRPVVDTVVTSRRPWKITVIPPRKRHCRKRPKSLVPERVDAGRPARPAPRPASCPAARRRCRGRPGSAPPRPPAPRGAPAAPPAPASEPVSPIIRPSRDSSCGEATTARAVAVRVALMLEERGIEHAAGSQAWLRRTLEEIVSQVRRLLDVTGVSFLVVDQAHAHIRPAASWFASDAVRDAFVPGARPAVRARARGRHRGRGGDRQPRADRAHRGLAGRRRPARPAVRAPRRRHGAERLWDWYSTSSFLSCPVRTRDGRILGVLAIARSLPQPAFSAEDLRVTEVLADLAAFALERAAAARRRGGARPRRAGDQRDARPRRGRRRDDRAGPRADRGRGRRVRAGGRVGPRDRRRRSRC